MLTINVQAQTSDVDYFAGKWSVEVKDTPNGDATMIFALEKSESGLTGTMQDSTGTVLVKLDEVELKDDQATLYFFAGGYDIYLVMNKKDEDHVSGNMLDMFDAEGKRIK